MATIRVRSKPMPASISKAHQHQQKANKARRAIYRNEQRRDQNRAKRLIKHLLKYPWDSVCHTTLKNINPLALQKAGVTIPKLTESPKQAKAKAKAQAIRTLESHQAL